MYDFHIGQHVVCVDDTNTDAFGLQEIVRGKVYTVRGLAEPNDYLASMFGNQYRDNEAGLFLVEVHRGIDFSAFGEVPFAVSRFRPLDDRRLDVFRAHLAPFDQVPA